LAPLRIDATTKRREKHKFKRSSSQRHRHTPTTNAALPHDFHFFSHLLERRLRHLLTFELLDRAFLASHFSTVNMACVQRREGDYSSTEHKHTNDRATSHKGQRLPSNTSDMWRVETTSHNDHRQQRTNERTYEIPPKCGTHNDKKRSKQSDDNKTPRAKNIATTQATTKRRSRRNETLPKLPEPICSKYSNSSGSISNEPNSFLALACASRAGIALVLVDEDIADLHIQTVNEKKNYGKSDPADRRKYK
jgi:hypothetical protein